MAELPTLVRWLITLSLVALIVGLSVVPGHPKPGDSSFTWLVALTPTLLQKMMHVLIYAVLAMLWAWTLESLGPRWVRIALALLLSIGLGAALEWYQTKIPGRFGSLVDVLLNAAGAIAGIVVALFLL